jgi:hypothetical protein
MCHLDVSSANPLFQNKENDFTIVHHNIQSLPAHVDDMQNNHNVIIYRTMSDDFLPPEHFGSMV